MTVRDPLTLAPALTALASGWWLAQRLWDATLAPVRLEA